MSVIVRFAPSPTGRLHIGNVRTALLNWLYARRHGGQFILRLDDTDTQRSTEAFAEAIKTDLQWLGLTWDSSFRQSDRTARYAEAAEQLKAAGRLYPCYEAEDELDRRRKRQQARGLPPLYDRGSLKLTAEERAALEASGVKPHWRFKLLNTKPDDPDKVVPSPVVWNDLVRGTQTVDAGSLSDPVLQRADGSFLYTFTSVVDDIDTKITQVVRGEDHVTNTGVQIQLFQALGGAVPQFAHFSLLVDKDGSALSKRLGSLSVDGLRAEGLEAMAVNAHAALIGTSDPVIPHLELETLFAGFDFAKLSRSPSRFDIDELKTLNSKLLNLLPYAAVQSRLATLGADGGEALWLAVRGNLARLDDAVAWQHVVSAPITPQVEDADFLAQAADVLPSEPWSEETWGAWTTAVKTQTGAKGRALFHPLRLALTARDTGPDMKSLLPLIGRARTLARLKGETA
jgi:glutamyl-tRNA synthetase